MRRLPLVLALAAICAPASAAEGGVEVSQAWSRPAAAGMNGAGYMTLRNTGSAPVTLKAIETPAATRTEVHRTVMTGSVMSMRPEPALTIGAGQTVMFGPNGLHVMLLGLKQPLKVGASFPATVVFTSGARVATTFRVGLAAAAGGTAQDLSGHDHGGMAH